MGDLSIHVPSERAPSKLSENHKINHWIWNIKTLYVSLQAAMAIGLPLSTWTQTEQCWAGTQSRASGCNRGQSPPHVSACSDDGDRPLQTRAVENIQPTIDPWAPSPNIALQDVIIATQLTRYNLAFFPPKIIYNYPWVLDQLHPQKGRP